MTKIVCEEVAKAYDGALVLDGFDLAVSPGETYALLGPNGAGKTTAFKVLLGLEQPDSGLVRIAGQALEDGRREALAHVGYVPEIVPVDGGKTALQNVRELGMLHGRTSEELEDDAPRLLSLVGLEHTEGKRVESFSKGMRQRLGIARSLVHRPDFLLLDEPFTGLDPSARRELQSLVTNLASGGLGILLATHNLAEAEDVCDRVGILHAGTLRHEAPLTETQRTANLRALYDRYTSMEAQA